MSAKRPPSSTIIKKENGLNETNRSQSADGSYKVHTPTPPSFQRGKNTVFKS
jgi:hypothetical protein